MSYTEQGPMTRFESKGGYFSEGDTFAELTSVLRRAEELCYMIGHHSKENGDTVRGDGFLRVGQQLEKTRDIVTKFATAAGTRTQ